MHPQHFSELTHIPSTYQSIHESIERQNGYILSRIHFPTFGKTVDKLTERLVGTEFTIVPHTFNDFLMGVALYQLPIVGDKFHAANWFMRVVK